MLRLMLSYFGSIRTSLSVAITQNVFYISFCFREQTANRIHKTLGGERPPPHGGWNIPPRLDGSEAKSGTTFFLKKKVLVWMTWKLNLCLLSMHVNESLIWKLLTWLISTALGLKISSNWRWSQWEAQRCYLALVCPPGWGLRTEAFHPYLIWVF